MMLSSIFRKEGRFQVDQFDDEISKDRKPQRLHLSSYRREVKVLRAAKRKEEKRIEKLAALMNERGMLIEELVALKAKDDFARVNEYNKSAEGMARAARAK